MSAASSSEAARLSADLKKVAAQLVTERRGNVVAMPSCTGAMDGVDPHAGTGKRRLTPAQRELVRWLVRQELKAWAEK